VSSIAVDAERAVQRPKVSVFMLTYNHATWIGEAIESALAQVTPFPVEILIADDCSTDGTRAIVREYAERHPEKIRLLLPEENLGVVGIWPRAARLCRGEYVAILEGDDYWTSPEKLARQVALLDSHRDWMSCFHGATLFHEQGGFPDRPATPAFDRHVFELDDVLRACFIPFLTVMFRRVALQGVPDWIFTYKWFDWLFHIHCARQGKIGHFDDDLAAYRVHDRGNWSSRDRSSQIGEDLRVYQCLLDELPQRRELIERCMEHRHGQLAVETCGIPFDTPVLLLEPVGDMQPYFNGRHAAALRICEDAGELDGRLSAAMRSLRDQAKSQPAPAPHYPARVAPSASSVGSPCACLVPSSGLAAVEGSQAVMARLGAQGRLCWRDEWCCIWEVEVDSPTGPARSRHQAAAQMGALVEISGVSLSEPLSKELSGGFLDEPKAGATVDAHALDVLGWALGADARATAVELSIAGEVFSRAPLGWERPDLGEAFPDHSEAARAGFRTTLNMIGTPAEFELEVSVVLKGQHRVSLGTIQGRHRWRRDRSPVFAELVSVIIPCFGQAHYLGEAIESVLGQSYPHLEVVVVDDTSPDNVSPIASRYPGVKYVRCEDSGVSAARNLGIRGTNGDFLVFLDADDRLLSDAIEIGLQALAEHEECACAVGRYRRISHGGEPLNTHDQPPILSNQYAQLMRDNWAGFPGRAIYRRSLFEHVRGFDLDRQQAEDFALSLEIARQFPIWSHDELVVEHREHDRNTSGDAAAMLLETLAALRQQRTHVRGDRELKRAYREGRRHWKAYYGDLLAAQVRHSLRERHWLQAWREVALLTRHRPTALARLIGPQRTVSA
jgi:glycosyltransferase involved in cell wall biosynthesis